MTSDLLGGVCISWLAIFIGIGSGVNQHPPIKLIQSTILIILLMGLKNNSLLQEMVISGSSFYVGYFFEMRCSSIIKLYIQQMATKKGPERVERIKDPVSVNCD